LSLPEINNMNQNSLKRSLQKEKHGTFSMKKSSFQGSGFLKNNSFI